MWQASTLQGLDPTTGPAIQPGENGFGQSLPEKVETVRHPRLDGVRDSGLDSEARR